MKEGEPQIGLISRGDRGNGILGGNGNDLDGKGNSLYSHGSQFPLIILLVRLQSFVLGRSKWV